LTNKTIFYEADRSHNKLQTTFATLTTCAICLLSTLEAYYHSATSLIRQNSTKL